MNSARSVGRALRHRNYRLFFSGQLVSLIGTWMQSVAQSWLVYRLTGSTVLLGVVGFAGQIPVFLLAPIGGVVADRFPRHRVVVATQVVMMCLAFTLAALTLLHAVRVPHVIVLATCLGIANAFDIPARQSFLVEMVGREDLPNAIALNSSMVTGARILGPALAGVTVTAVGEGWCFFGNGLSFVAVLAGLLSMRDLPPQRSTDTDAPPLERIREGFAFVLRTTPIRSLLLLLGFVSLTAVPYSTLMPAIADRVLGHGADGLGLLMGATGIGALGGALMLAANAGRRDLFRGVAACSALFGASLIAFSRSQSFWLSFVLLIPTGFGFMVQMAATNTLVQSMSPDRLRGRVMAVYSMMFMGTAPLGALLAGTISARIGPPLTVMCGGIATLLAALLFAVRLPQLREAIRAAEEGRNREGRDSAPLTLPRAI